MKEKISIWLKRNWFIGCTILMIAFTMMGQVVFAHPGGTDSSGCHTCRTNCPSWGLSYGEYHCHRAKALPQPAAPIKSTFGENGTGYTQPAPEYENSSASTLKNINKAQTTVSEPVIPQTRKGFWQWLFGLFR